MPVSVKLNSADFQRGGFDFNESLQVAKWLEEASVDLIEISGGTYEQPRLLNLEGMEPVEEQSVAASTRAREAYFVDFAEAMRKIWQPHTARILKPSGMTSPWLQSIYCSV